MAKIRFHLSESGIDKAIRELRAYQQRVLDKNKLFQKRLADEIAELAQTGFDNSLVDDILKGEPHIADVTVTATEKGGAMVVIAHGEDAVWCEFGAGVYHNTPVGTSPNPLGPDLGFTIGSFGKGHGSRKVWGYKDESGELTLTRGTPATMPMYEAMTVVADEVQRIAQEVFGND